MRGLSALISTQSLHQRLSSRQSSLKILDASWTVLKGGRDSFVSKHIPQAGFFDLNYCVKAKPSLPRNLPEPTCLEEYLQSLGVRRDSHVVVYDRGNILPSARTWWTLRAYGHKQVSVLDGGLKKWEEDGFETENGSTERTQKGDFSVDIDRSLIKSFDDMVDILRTKAVQIVDGRQPKHFYGEEEEPTKFSVNALKGMDQPIPASMHRGHIPGAKNLLEDLLLDPKTNCLLPKEDLIKMFETMSIDLSAPMVTMCYNGHAATLLALAAHVCGKTDTSVYYGSWTEWGQRAQTNMVDGATTRRALGA